LKENVIFESYVSQKAEYVNLMLKKFLP